MLPKFLTDLDPDIYLSDNYVVLDFEVDTSHGDYGNPVHPDNRMLLGCFKLGPGHPGAKACGTGVHSIWADEYSTKWNALEAALKGARFFVAHQAKYELGWMRRMGFKLRKLLPFDTRLAEYVLLGNLSAGNKKLGMQPLSTSLDMCCRRRGMKVKDPVVDIMMKAGINPVRVPKKWLEDRCKQDVETTEQVFLHQRTALKASNRLPVLYTRCLVTPVLADIEPQGLCLDKDRVKAEYDKYKALHVELSARMDAMTGGINWRSPKQIATFIYETLGFEEMKDWRGQPKRTPAGGRQTSNKVLEKLKAKTKAQKDFLELRKELGKVGALLSKNLEYFMGVCNEYDGVFYAELHQANTATHRLASTGIPLSFCSIAEGGAVTRTVQMQNIPRQFKKLLRARRKGWLLAEPDGSSLEFRVATELGGPDEGALRDIETGWDVHSFTASILHNCSIERVKEQQKEADKAGQDSWRQDGKPDTFKPLYGGTKGTEEQERYYAAFRLRYPGIAAVQQAWVEEAVETRQLTTPWGLVYFFPTARRERSGYINVTSTVYNYPIQALATAEIIPIALVYMWHRIPERGLEDKVVMVNTVHDSAPCEVEPSAAVPFIDLCKQCFTKDVYHYLQLVYGLDFKTPLGVGIKLGSHWGQGEEMQFNIWKDGREKRVK